MHSEVCYLHGKQTHAHTDIFILTSLFSNIIIMLGYTLKIKHDPEYGNIKMHNKQKWFSEQDVSIFVKHLVKKFH